MRFYAFHVPSWELLDGDLPLTAPSITRALSTPKALDGTLPRQYAHLVDESGESLIREWGTVIVADPDSTEPTNGRQVDVFIVDGIGSATEQGEMTITAGGVASYAKDQPWLPANATVLDALDDLHAATPKHTLKSGAAAGGIGWVRKISEVVGVEVDPLDMVRAIWTQILSAPDSNIRMTVDDTRSQVRIGEEERDQEFTANEGEEDEEQVSFTSGPHRMNWHNTHDLGQELDNLAEETPFEWVEESVWHNGLPQTVYRIAHPKFPEVRRDQLFFELGHNVTAINEVEWSDYANVVLVVGSGEGAGKPKSHMSRSSTRLRRVHVDSDSEVSSTSRARERARKLLDDLISAPAIDQITVKDTPSAPFGTFGLGDTITVRVNTPWLTLADDYRIVELTHDLDADTQELVLEEVDRG